MSAICKLPLPCAHLLTFQSRRWYLPNFLMGADPNASVEPFAQITGVPRGMRSDRPLRPSEMTGRTDISRLSEISRHDAAMPRRLAPLQPGQMVHQSQHMLLPSHSHERSSSGGGQRISHAQYPSMGAYSARRRFHHQTGQPLEQSEQYTYPIVLQQPIPQLQFQPPTDDSQLQSQSHQVQKLEYPTEKPEQQAKRQDVQQEPQPPQGLQEELQPPQELQLQPPQYQIQPPQRPVVVLPRDVHVQVLIRRTYLVQVFPRRRIRLKVPRCTASANPTAADRRALMSSSASSLLGRRREGAVSRMGRRSRRPPPIMTPFSSMDYGIEACLEGKAL